MTPRILVSVLLPLALLAGVKSAAALAPFIPQGPLAYNVYLPLAQKCYTQPLAAATTATAPTHTATSTRISLPSDTPPASSTSSASVAPTAQTATATLTAIPIPSGVPPASSTPWASATPTARRLPAATSTVAHEPGHHIADYAGCTVREEYDDLVADGLDHVIVTTFNDVGLVERIDYDYDANGAVEAVAVYTYDQSWLLVKIEGDRGPDGKTDSVRTFLYDSQGRLVRLEDDLDMDGDSEYFVDYRYDDAGNLVMERDSTTIMKHLYDESGFRVRTEYYFDSDDVPDGIDTYVWSAGLVTRIEEDYGADGVVDFRTWLTYDGHGRLERSVTRDRGGAVQHQYAYEYSPQTGWLIRQTHYVGEFPEDVLEFTYDAFGRLIEQYASDAFEPPRRWSYVNQCP